jgi:hypothetical protein
MMKSFLKCAVLATVALTVLAVYSDDASAARWRRNRHHHDCACSTPCQTGCNTGCGAANACGSSACGANACSPCGQSACGACTTSTMAPMSPIPLDNAVQHSAARPTYDNNGQIQQQGTTYATPPRADIRANTNLNTAPANTGVDVNANITPEAPAPAAPAPVAQ